MTTVQSGSRTTVNVNGTAVEMYSGGSGPPLVFFHGAGGSNGWQPYHEDLSAEYTVYVPSQPGFNGTEAPNWIKTISDVAHFNHMFVDALGLQDIVLMGSSMGGWVSAEMAAMDDHNIDALVLVDAAGIKPREGEIAEIFMVSADTRLKQRFYDPGQVENYENYARELSPEDQLVSHSNAITASQLCWKPYLYNPSLPIPSPGSTRPLSSSGATRMPSSPSSAGTCSSRPSRAASCASSTTAGTLRPWKSAANSSPPSPGS